MEDEENVCPKCGGMKFWQVYEGEMRSFCPCEFVEEK